MKYSQRKQQTIFYLINLCSLILSEEVQTIQRYIVTNGETNKITFRGDTCARKLCEELPGYSVQANGCVCRCRSNNYIFFTMEKKCISISTIGMSTLYLFYFINFYTNFVGMYCLHRYKNFVYIYIFCDILTFN